MNWFRTRRWMGLLPAMAILAVGTVAASAPQVNFKMVRSGAAEAAKCLPKATAQVRVRQLGLVEVVDLSVANLAPNTTYSFFTTQVPNLPFGVSWYNGEIETDAYGRGQQQYIGRFNGETFAVAPGAAPAPVVHNDKPFPDASRNPQFNPVHTFHLGLWFSDPKDAAKAGCTDQVTPFDGDHVAGIQVLSTRQFADNKGPLLQVQP